MNPQYADGLEMLPMPQAVTLTDVQIDGAVCVWCSGTPELKLGPRISVVGGSLSRWWPRACRSCVAREAGRVYAVHIRSCQRCTGRAYCLDGRALHALTVEAPAQHAGRAGRSPLEGRKRP